MRNFESHYNAISQQIKDLTKQQKEEIKKLKKRKNLDSDNESCDQLSISIDDELEKIKSKYKIPMNTWIVKPGENTNRG